jgi:hypothetical protein
MGVMGCHREGCGNIMCDTYVDGIGYVCNECQKEFKDYLEKEGLTPQREGEIRRELQKFMATEKSMYDMGKEMTINEFFNKHDRHN